MQERLFSEAELREMEKRTVDRLAEAIDAGDADKAKQIAKRMYNEFLSMHDLYRNWTTAMLSEIGRRFGDEVLEQVMTEGVKAWWLPNLEKLPDGPEALPQRVKMFVAGLRGHLQPLHIEEDEEKVVIQMRPCGTGRRAGQGALLVHHLQGQEQGAGQILRAPGAEKAGNDRQVGHPSPPPPVQGREKKEAHTMLHAG